MELSQPFFINNWPVYVNRDFYLNYLYFLLCLHWPIHVYGFIDIDRFIDNNWISVDWFFYKYLLFYYLWNLNLLYYKLWNSLLYLYVLWNLHYPFH